MEEKHINGRKSQQIFKSNRRGISTIQVNKVASYSNNDKLIVGKRLHKEPLKW